MAALPASGFPSRLREATASRPVGISRAPNPRCATHRGNPRRPILLAHHPPPARRSAQRSEFCQNQRTLKRYATINQFWILSSAERRRGGDPESTMCSFLPHLDQDCDCAGRSHAEVFAVVRRVRFVDERRAGGGEFRPRDVDAVLEWRAGAAWVGGGLRGRAGAPVIVDGHELLVLERQETPLESGFENGTSWKVERGAEVLRGPEDEEPAGPARIRCRHGAALEYLAGEIRVALAIPSHGCVC